MAGAYEGEYPGVSHLRRAEHRGLTPVRDDPHEGDRNSSPRQGARTPIASLSLRPSHALRSANEITGVRSRVTHRVA